MTVPQLINIITGLWGVCRSQSNLSQYYFWEKSALCD